VHGSDGSISKKIFRCPLAHKVGERYSPGVVDEKMSAEAGAYVWIEENCPEIPAPKLHAFIAFGFSPDLQADQLIFTDLGDYVTHHILIVHTQGERRRLHSRPIRKQV
jgi:hypothetical protein